MGSCYCYFAGVDNVVVCCCVEQERCMGLIFAGTEAQEQGGVDDRDTFLHRVRDLLSIHACMCLHQSLSELLFWLNCWNTRSCLCVEYFHFVPYWICFQLQLSRVDCRSMCPHQVWCNKLTSCRLSFKHYETKCIILCFRTNTSASMTCKFLCPSTSSNISMTGGLRFLFLGAWS